MLEDRPAVVVDDHDREVRPRLVGPEDQPVGVVQERHVAHQRDGARAVRPAQGGADRGGDGAVDAGQAPVGDHLAAFADGVGAGHQVEVADRAGGADDEQALGRQGAAHRARDLVRRQFGLGGEQRVQPLRDAAVGREPLLEPRRVVGRSAVGAVTRGRPGTVAPPTTPGARRGEHLDVVAGQQPGDRAGQRRVAEHDHPLDPLRRARSRAGAGSSGARSLRCGRRWSVRRTTASRRARPGPGPAGRRRRPRPPRCAGRSRERSARRGCSRARARAAGGAGVQRSSGSSGSSSWTLRCTGPSAERPASSRLRRRRAVRTSLPKMPTWSVVWLAPVPRSRAGRSAVTIISGRPACAASSTAGCRLARPCRTCR